MVDSTTLSLARCVADASRKWPELVHPNFADVMTHAALTGNGYLREAARDHAPLTDLRLRRDTSSKALLELNIAVLSARDPGFRRAIAELTDERLLDNTACHVRAVVTGMRGSPAGHVPQLQDVTDAYTSLLKYVNAFGNWDDARAVARRVFDVRGRWGTSLLETTTVALAAVVLGLCGDETHSDQLFLIALTELPNSIERTFWGLRWASIQAKRRGQLDAAETLIAALEADLEGLNAHADDLAIASGMLWNFRGLIETRRRNPEQARRAVTRAVALFEQCDHSEVAGGELNRDEARRYEWMARLNLIQLDIFQGVLDPAIEQLARLAEFSRRYDPRSLHTSLSTLAYVHIQAGEPARAIPYLLEAHELLRSEYDPFVVVQVRKMLARCYFELGRLREVSLVDALPKEFWLPTPLSGE